jgi:hypothetical protein
LVALLPFPASEYETTFTDSSTSGEFRDLLSRSSEAIELPGTLADTKGAYEVVGHEMVDRSDLLVAVWDGKPSAGRGGTPEIIEYALEQGCPVMWIDSAQDNYPQRFGLARHPGAPTRWRRNWQVDRLGQKVQNSPTNLTLLRCTPRCDREQECTL